MAWTSDRDELTEAQKIMAQIAGVPSDRPGLGDEYPKAVYRKGVGESLYGEPFKVAGNKLDVASVNDHEEEAEAIAQGWYLSPDLEAEKKRMDALAQKDAEIAALQARLQQQDGGQANDAPRRGRPPKSLTEAQDEATA